MIYLTFFNRLFWISVFRFFVMQLLMQFYNNFEVSPLPAWTLTMFIYLLYVAVAGGFALWLWRFRLPARWQFISTLIAFVFLQAFFELIMFKLFTFGTWSEIIKLYTLSSFLIPFFSIGALFCAGVVGAYWFVRRSALRTTQTNNVL